MFQIIAAPTVTKIVAPPTPTQAILEQSNHALSAIGAVNATLQNLINVGAALFAAIVALAAGIGIFAFKGALGEVKRQAAQKADEVQNEYQRRLTVAEEELKGKMASFEDEIKSRSDASIESIVRAQSEYMEGITTELAAIKVSIGERVEEMAHSQLRRFEDLLRELPEITQEQVEAFISKAHEQNELQRLEHQRKMDELLKSASPGPKDKPGGLMSVLFGGNPDLPQDLARFDAATKQSALLKALTAKTEEERARSVSEFKQNQDLIYRELERRSNQQDKPSPPKNS